MANNKLSDGVGKKIVEALKKQSEIEITPISKAETNEDAFLTEDSLEAFVTDSTESQDLFQKDDFLNNLPSDDDLEDLVNGEEDLNSGIVENLFAETPVAQPQSFINYQQASSQPINKIPDSFGKELDSFEIPSNIAVLKKLIAQLPSGVTRHTGAQIIRQTMEALGISMKSVLQEAQQVQDGLSSSVKECHATIQEYKRQILLHEKQAQNHQKQYAALNELISLFIQTGL